MRRRLNIPAPHRRGFLTAAAGLLGATSLAGCDRLAGTETGARTLKLGEDANLYVQRLLLTPASLAREFPDSEISPWFKPNGTTAPEDKPYKALAAKNFEGFKLRVDGLVEHPHDFSLADLRALPARTQTTRHDCVEGWSAIGKWSGVPLSEVLKKAGLKPQARYIVFHCADTMEFAEGGESDEQAADDTDAPAAPKKGGAVAWGGEDKPDAGSDTGPNAKAKTNNPDMEAKPVGAENQASDDRGSGQDEGQGSGRDGSNASRARRPIRYYESIDLTDAYHPQTILAYDLNGKVLPVSNGAPLRLRVERQLGYKQAKYVMRIEVAESLRGFGDGNGGYWEDRGYEWYAGI